ncbi:MAG TPA: TonB-dependent receptor, partial [Steroidobacteraceae bacterium]|nr:TonB-dependent receptor [Steroidobacteraceae bacterium]
MSKRYLNKTLYVAVVAALYANVGQAQQQPAPVAQQGELESVIVTGSYIRGTPEDSALPVDVVTAEDLAEQGSPTVVQLVKTITASQSAIGESNRYNVGAGTAQINLRGFGAARSLVLMNGRRLSDNPIAAGQNLNFIPSAAVGRVEILKDGAAATYGSDAVGGVINFITRTDLDGVELNGEYSAIDGSDGDYQGSVAWGSKFDGGGNVLLTLGYRHRSRLDVQDRDWALARYDDLGYGGWTGAGNPGVYVQNTTSNAPPTLFRDNGCTELGGQLTTGALGQPTSSTAIGSTCRYQFATFNDIVNIEDHYQVHGEANFPVGDGTKFHGEMTWARDYVPQQRLSPANLSTQFPTPTTLGGTSGSIQTPGALNFFVRNNVPANNPGLADLVANCATSGLALGAGQTCGTLAAAVAAGGVDISQTTWRAIAHAGHPTNKDKADRQTVDSKAFRISAGLSGEVFETLNWDTAFTYMNSRSDVGTNDLLVDRIQLALNGFGQNVGDTGDGCTAADRAALGTTSTVAQHNARGCFFFNPFTNSIAVSAVNGQANPYYRGGANPAVNNTPELVEWLYGHYDNKFSAGIFVTDAVVSGPTGLELPGGDLAFALGTQFRYTTDKNEYGDLFNNRVNPCVDSIDDDTPVCGAPAGPLIFFGSNNNSEYTRSVWAGFGELQIPVLDSLDFSLALRYESYPGELGSTTDPKLSVRWQALDWFALRGSIGTTFRAPTPTQVDPGCSTGVANIGGQYRAVETCGNSALKPETADAINLGLIFNPGNFTATLDYFKFKFEGELINESSSRLYATMFPTGVALTVPGPGGVGTVPNLNHPCNNSGFLPLKNRFQF